MNKMRNSITKTLAALLICISAAGQDTYVYDANLGTFPSDQGFIAIEDQLTRAAIVTNGILHTFPTVFPDGVQYFRQTNTPIDFSATPYVMEATLRVISANYTKIPDGNHRSGYYFAVADNSARHFMIGLSSTNIVINTDSGLSPTQGVRSISFNTTDTFHTYRFIIEGGRGTLFIDGREFAWLPVGMTGMAQVFPNVAFGDASGYGVSEAELRRFRFSRFGPSTTIEVSEVRVCWDSLTNRMYQAQYRSELTTNVWVDLGTPVAGNGTTNCITDSVFGPRRFYQVILLP